MIGSVCNLLILIDGWFLISNGKHVMHIQDENKLNIAKKYIQDRRSSRPTTAKTFDCHVSFMENYV